MKTTPVEGKPAADTKPLAGKVALVTGGAIRVGRAIALRLAAEGMDVAITYNSSKAEAARTVQLIERLGRRGAAIQVDFAGTAKSPAAAVQEVHRQFKKQFRRLDALVNNASIFSPSPLMKFKQKDFDRNMAVNALAPLLLIQKFAPLLGTHFDPNDPTTMGRIVNFVDIHVLGQPLKGFVAYNASKAALLEITMTLAMELAPRISVNALAPGVVAWAESYTARQRVAYMRRVPLGRPGTPKDAADAALFFIRDAHYSTGQVIQLDGGRLWT